MAAKYLRRGSWDHLQSPLVLHIQLREVEDDAQSSRGTLHLSSRKQGLGFATEYKTYAHIAEVLWGVRTVIFLNVVFTLFLPVCHRWTSHLKTPKGNYRLLRPCIAIQCVILVCQRNQVTFPPSSGCRLSFESSADDVWVCSLSHFPSLEKNPSRQQ